MGSRETLAQSLNSIAPSPGTDAKKPESIGPVNEPVNHPVPGIRAMAQAVSKTKDLPFEPLASLQILTQFKAIGVTITILTVIEGVSIERTTPIT